MPGFVVYIKRHSSSSDRKRIVSNRRSRLSVSERTQPSITRFARLIPLPRAARCKSPPGCLLIAHEVRRLKPFPLRSKVIRLQLAMPLSPHRGRMIAFALPFIHSFALRILPATPYCQGNRQKNAENAIGKEKI